MYVGDKYMGTEVSWDEGSCVTVYFFYDEWVPWGTTDDIPPEDPGGGGPFFDVSDSLQREPSIDTLPSRNHLCPHIDSTGTRIDRKCAKLLQGLDSALVFDSLDIFLRPLPQIADTIARRECDSLRVWWRGVRDYSADPNYIPLVYIGATDPVTPGSPEHDAQSAGLGSATDPRTFHIDPKVFVQARLGALGRKRLLISALHESAHAWGGVDHPDSSHVSAGGYANYPYFRSLHGANACVL